MSEIDPAKMDAETARSRLIVIAADSMSHPLRWGHMIGRAMREIVDPLLTERARLAAEVATLREQVQRVRLLGKMWNGPEHKAGVYDSSHAIEVREALDDPEAFAKRFDHYMGVWGTLDGDQPKPCGQRHPFNDSMVPCMRRAGHDGDHWSTSGCEGGQFAWDRSGADYFHDGNPDDQPKSEADRTRHVCIGRDCDSVECDR